MLTTLIKCTTRSDARPNPEGTQNMTPAAAPLVEPERPDPSALRRSPRCFACGLENPRGLQLRFFAEAPGRVWAEWKPSADFEGFAGIVHGGIVATVLDEAMSIAIRSSGWAALTCNLDIRLMRHLTTGQTFVVRGRVVERRKRRIEAAAIVVDPNKMPAARARATFLAMSSRS
jgi:acyl-coenzyme A thioesterase PaaI-like protein